MRVLGVEEGARAVDEEIIFDQSLSLVELVVLLLDPRRLSGRLALLLLFLKLSVQVCQERIVII